ncbi:MAG: penicillin-binding protein 2 [Deltaproteobacteria bacterium]|nr:MAG: penicillin-binding protein 2 [Deltaproteobacteria bacterium]
MYSTNIKLRFFSLLFGLSLTILASFIPIIKILQNSTSYEAIYESQFLKYIYFNGSRGSILDRNGNILATNMLARSFNTHPEQEPLFKRSKNLLDSISSLSDLHIIRHNKNPSKLSIYTYNHQNMNFSKNIQVTKFKPHKNLKRIYPFHGLLGQSLGSVNLDNLPLNGFEKTFHFYLNSFRSFLIPSLINSKKSKFNNCTAPLPYDLKAPDLWLTINSNIQFITESILQKTIEQFNAAGGWAIVMLTTSGEILAIANAPCINPNNSSQSYENDLRNSSLARSFEPGSIFKIVTMAANLENDLSDPDFKIYCENGLLNVNNIQIKDVSSKQWLSRTEIFKYSSNIGSFKLAERIGEKVLYEYIHKLGFGKYILDIPHSEEARGSVPKIKEWNFARFANISYGYGLTTTSLQLLNMINSIANNGIQIPPKILKQISSSNNVKKINPISASRKRILTEQAALNIKNMMLEVVKNGSGKRAYTEGLLIAGKTGTVEKVLNKSYNKTLNISSFAGFAPAFSPIVSALICIDEPKPQAFGGIVAAPAWKEIIELTLLELGS